MPSPRPCAPTRSHWPRRWRRWPAIGRRARSSCSRRIAHPLLDRITLLLSGVPGSPASGAAAWPVRAVAGRHPCSRCRCTPPRVISVQRPRTPCGAGGRCHARARRSGGRRRLRRPRVRRVPARARRPRGCADREPPRSRHASDGRNDARADGHWPGCCPARRRACRERVGRPDDARDATRIGTVAARASGRQTRPSPGTRCTRRGSRGTDRAHRGTGHERGSAVCARSERSDRRSRCERSKRGAQCRRSDRCTRRERSDRLARCQATDRGARGQGGEVCRTGRRDPCRGAGGADEETRGQPRAEVSARHVTVSHCRSGGAFVRMKY